jgi:peptidoglycan/xylan/chitin deacetylase (PgdA/CDA1 family)
LSAAIAATTLSGCGSRQAQKPAAEPTKGPPHVSDDTIRKVKPNEAGAIMVLMYHRFLPDEPDNDLNRKPATFRHDLELLRDHNYYPVTALELVENKMDVPAGKTPVVLTFDDALPSQFEVRTGSDGQPHIAPDCAVGIMETFHKEHADWPTRGTFFVLPKAGRNTFPFGQAESVGDKFSYLEKHGYEIANHTSTHSSMRGMSADKVQWELANAKKMIQEIAPGAPMKILALPYGQVPRNDAARAKLLKGENGGVSYQHEAVFLAAWRPVLSPVTKKDKSLTNGGHLALFDIAGLERVKPDPQQAKMPGTFEYWLKYFQENPSQRYVSDGELEVVTVPVSSQSAVDEARVRAQGKILQTYGGAKDKSGGDLSVQ